MKRRIMIAAFAIFSLILSVCVSVAFTANYMIASGMAQTPAIFLAISQIAFVFIISFVSAKHAR